MRRNVLISGVILALLLLSLGVAVNLRTGDAEPLPAPDPALPITLPDGSELPLAELLARIERREPLVAPPLGTGVLPEDDLGPEELARLKAALPGDFGIPSAVWHAQFGTVFALAEEHLHRGNLDQAEALYLSIRPGEPGHAYAQRRVAWSILTLGRGEPERAVAYAHAALRAEPFNANSWQDAVRVYGSTLGFAMR